MTTTITLDIVNPFSHIDDDDVDVRYYLFLATHDNQTLLDENNTWASVYEKDPPFAYVTMVCERLSTQDGCVSSSSRRKRATGSPSSIVITIGEE